MSIPANAFLRGLAAGVRPCIDLTLKFAQIKINPFRAIAVFNLVITTFPYIVVQKPYIAVEGIDVFISQLEKPSA
jgi:hypothetical protein